MNSYQCGHKQTPCEESQGEKPGVIANCRLPIVPTVASKRRWIDDFNLVNKLRIPSSALRIPFTLVELLIVIAIIAILAAMLLPALKAAKNKATSMVCIGQMKQLVFTNQMYISDYNEYPATIIPAWAGAPNLWYELLTPYLGNKLTVWGCPANELAPLLNTPYNYANPTASNTLFKQVASVGCNDWAFRGRDNSNKLLLYRTNFFKEPSKLVYCADGRTGNELQAAGGNMNLNTCLQMRPTDPVAPYQNKPGTYSYYVRHTKIINNGFLDGHAEGIYYNEFLSWCSVTADQKIRFTGFW